MPNKKACDLRPTLFAKKKNLKQKDARHAPFHDETMRNQKSSCLIISQQPVSVQTIVPPQVLLHLSKTAAQSSPIGFRPCIPSLISHAISDLVFAPYRHLLCLSDIFIQNTKKKSKYRGNTRSETPSYIYVSNSAAENVISFCK